MRLLSLSFVFLSAVTFATDAESFCTSELSSMFAILHAERGEAAKQYMLEKRRDEVLTSMSVSADWNKKEVLLEAMALPYDEYFKFVMTYVTRLEEKVDWKDGKTRLITILKGVIRDARGNDATKQELLSQVDETSLIPFSDFVATLEKIDPAARAQQQTFLSQACGKDALIPGGIATIINGKRVFTFCPGSMLRASVLEVSAGKHAWADSVQLDAILFTAFHELGHLLGAEPSGKFRPLHDNLMSCLNSMLVPFPKAQEAEVLADFWGATALVADLKERNLQEAEIIERVALNLSVLKNGSFGSYSHPALGARQQVVLTQVCSKLLGQDVVGGKCALELGASK